MSFKSVFTTKLQLVNLVLEELGEKPLPAILPDSSVEIKLNACILSALRDRAWNFAKEVVTCEPEADIERFKSSWKIPVAVGEYAWVSNVFLREDLNRLRENFLWVFLPNGIIGTNFDKKNIVHPETSIKAEVIEFIDIDLWPPKFCNLICNDFKKLMADNFEAKKDVAAQCLQLRDYYFREAVKEDSCYSNQEIFWAR